MDTDGSVRTRYKIKNVITEIRERDTHIYNSSESIAKLRSSGYHFCFVISACKPTILTENYRGLPESLQEAVGIIPQIWPRQLPSTSISLNYLLPSFHSWL